MRAVFIGAVHFSLVCLEELLEAGASVAGVFTLGAERAGFHSDYADLAPVAERHGVPVHRVGNINDLEAIASIRSLAPDAIFVLGWSRLLGPDLLALAPCIGSHPALLPRDRGRHPITWALVDGYETSGLTFLWLDAGADSGDILWQRSFPIAPTDDAGDVYRRIEGLACEAIREFLPQLEAGEAPRIAQDEARATYRRKRTDDDRRITWGDGSVRTYNLIRGLARPYVGALTRREGQDVVVWKARLPEDSVAPEAEASVPGTVFASDAGGVSVRTGDGWLVLVETEPPGILEVGDVLGARA